MLCSLRRLSAALALAHKTHSSSPKSMPISSSIRVFERTCSQSVLRIRNDTVKKPNRQQYYVALAVYFYFALNNN
jgi:hypothetical protein